MPLKTLASFSKSSKKINYCIVAKILKQHGKAKRRLRKKPYLSPLHMRKQKEYCKSEKVLKHNPPEVIWNNKVIFEIREDRTVFFVTRGPGRAEEYATKNLRPSFKSGRTTIRVWSYFYRDEISLFYILPDRENMTAKRYY
jgi:hypothetical protein